MRQWGQAVVVVVGMFAAFAILTVASQVQAAATLPVGLGRYDTEIYRVGDEWGRHAVSKGSLYKENTIFARAAMAVGRYRRATSFYLGEFAGKMVMATNHHVQEDLDCAGARVTFPFAGQTYACTEVLASWRDVDVALFVIDVPAADKAYFADLAHPFAFDAAIYPGQKLLTLGYGIAGNPRQDLVAERDDDCMVFSPRNEFRYMRDPDALNRGPDAVWSFAHGCDISHGDSGSPLMDRTDGAVVGIVWTGGFPKSATVQSSAALHGLLGSRAVTVWEQLGYAVPAAKIKAHVLFAAQDVQLSASSRAVFAAMLK